MRPEGDAQRGRGLDLPARYRRRGPWAMSCTVADVAFGLRRRQKVPVGALAPSTAVRMGLPGKEGVCPASCWQRGPYCGRYALAAAASGRFRAQLDEPRQGKMPASAQME